MTLTRALLVLSTLVPASALGAPPPVQRLTDAQVEQVLAEAAARREAAEAAAPAKKIDIHGEIGVAIGTGGHRAAFGTAFVPLGEDGGASVSFVTSTGRARHGRRRR